MNKRVILRTARKISDVFVPILVFLGGLVLSMWVGQKFLGDPGYGIAFFFSIAAVLCLTYIAYKEAQYEIDVENQRLLRELAKND